MDLWNKPTYNRRLFIGLVVYSIILVGCFVCYQYFREKEFQVSLLDAQLQVVNDRIGLELANGQPVGQFEKPSVFNEMRISVIDKHGKVIYDNSLDTLPRDNHLLRLEIADAIKYGQGYTVRRHSESTGTSYFYSAKNVGDYVVRTAVPYDMTLNELLSADYGFIWIMALITGVMCVIGYFSTKRVGVLIERLNRFAEKAERGERIIDEEPFPHDELGEISNHIVRLYARLQQALADRDREHRAAMREEQEKIKIKRRLTNNINHELKTPVASMQVCLETLLSHKDLTEEKREEFLVRCYAANERLRRLLADVSVIARLEDGGQYVTREKVVVTEIIEEVVDEFKMEASQKGIEIVCHIAGKEEIDGNSQLIASIFRNLIANALAYSGGTRTDIKETKINGVATYSVSDNGQGVGEEHLDRIFERFYRIDSGRRRKVGGTGLGLSIVKNAVAWHGGHIKAENGRDGGLVFTFSLPGNTENRPEGDDLTGV